MSRDEPAGPLLGAPALHRIAAHGDCVLRVCDYRPVGSPRGMVVAGHAMMVDGRTLARSDRPCLVGTLVHAGFRVLVPDQRGHGASGPGAGAGGDWSYDDLVADVGRYVELAHRLEPDIPLTLLGHSLFGHASLAWSGRNPQAMAALVCIGVEVWNRRFESSRPRWWCKRASFALGMAIVHGFGYFPARALRMGSADESSSFWRQFHGFVARDHWSSRDGTDYWAGLEHIACPVLHLLSEGDRFYCPPRSAVAFTRGLRHREVIVLGRDDAPWPLSVMRPSHMGLVTDQGSRRAWRHVATWIRRRTG